MKINIRSSSYLSRQVSKQWNNQICILSREFQHNFKQKTKFKLNSIKENEKMHNPVQLYNYNNINNTNNIIENTIESSTDPPLSQDLVNLTNFNRFINNIAQLTDSKHLEDLICPLQQQQSITQSSSIKYKQSQKRIIIKLIKEITPFQSLKWIWRIQLIYILSVFKEIWKNIVHSNCQRINLLNFSYT